MESVALDEMPGFRRRFIVTPAAGQVTTEVEDDYHCMRVTLHHAGGVATAIDAVIERAPWTTCPGAPDELRRTFTGVPLAGFAARGAKQANCTHLHDLAILAATHADNAAPATIEILVSDPVTGRQTAELRRDGSPLLRWTFVDGRLDTPEEVAGLTLFELNPWLKTLDPQMRELAKLLRWGAIIAHGRQIPLANQSDATRMPPNCFTFQPERAAVAHRVGLIKDFSRSVDRPLDRRGDAVPARSDIA